MLRTRMIIGTLTWPVCWLAALAAAPLAAANDRPPHAHQIGVELDGLSDGSRERPFVDVARTLRPWVSLDGKQEVPLDEHDWPRSDAVSVMFDIRPAFAWAPPIDDPDRFQPDWSGTYSVSLRGQAKIEATEDRSCKIENQTYDSKTNLTHARLVVPKGVGIVVLKFTETRRAPNDPAGSGFTDLRVIRPGYPPDSKQLFTNEFLKSLEPFAILRYMDWLDTNHNPGFHGDKGHHALEWSGRRRPDDATQVSHHDRYGVAWEHVVALANQTGKDLWINIPVAATDDYIRTLAKMLKAELKPNLTLYIEHSNEVWNYGFPQYIYNKLAAIEEVKRGKSTLNQDDSRDQEIWARRRHAKRLIEIGKIFREVFGEKTATGRIRPVYASWLIFPEPYYTNVMVWVAKTYGPPRDLIYGLASGGYYNANKASSTASVTQILSAMKYSSDGNGKPRALIRALARSYGIKDLQYEVGPDNGGGKTHNIANRIRANRDPRMETLVLYDANQNWFNEGGDIYMYFSHCSSYSRFGCWGLSEDVTDLNTPKWQAIRKLTGWNP